jgi:gag-polypeptide of LTR copia-type
MSSTRHIKEPPIFWYGCKGFAYWKKCMTNYLKIIDLWDIVENGFTITKDANDKIDITCLMKVKQNDQAVNVILVSVHESIAPTFVEAINAHDMWIALIRKYEGNDMLKKAKEERLQSIFESFRIDEHESIEDMYTRFTILINEFIDVGDHLPTNKVVTKLIRVMMVRPSWRGYVGVLQSVQGREQFTPEEMYAHLKCYEETLRQAESVNSSHKTMAFAALNSKPYNSSNSSNHSSPNIFNPSSSQPRSSNEPYFQNFGNDQSKEIPILTKLMQAMFAFEKRVNLVTSCVNSILRLSISKLFLFTLFHIFG